MHVGEQTVTAADGWSLWARDVRPDGEPWGLVVAGHAMMVDGRTLYTPGRPSLGATLAEAGLRVLVPDLRGHGRSGPTAALGGRWRYDDLVADTAAWLELARRLAGPRPIVWLGHSMFGHTSLAWFGQHPADAPAAYVALAVNVWNHRNEPDKWLWARKRATMVAASTLARVYGRMPARSLRMGSNDEARGFWLDLDRFVARDVWASARGDDYYAGLPRLGLPALNVVSDGDALYTRPVDGIRFCAGLPRCEVLHLGAGCRVPALQGIVPTHMGLGTDPRSAPLWQHIAGWLRARLAG